MQEPEYVHNSKHSTDRGIFPIPRKAHSTSLSAKPSWFSCLRQRDPPFFCLFSLGVSETSRGTWNCWRVHKPCPNCSPENHDFEELKPQITLNDHLPLKYKNHLESTIPKQITRPDTSLHVRRVRSAANVQMRLQHHSITETHSVACTPPSESLRSWQHWNRPFSPQ